MTIEWNTITWYSRLLAIVFFVGILPVLNFYIGVKYQETTDALQHSADLIDSTYRCPDIPVKTSTQSTETTATASTTEE